MRKFDFFWKTNKNWYHRKENGAAVINDDAPPEAQESYKRYLEQSKRADEQVRQGISMD